LLSLDGWNVCSARLQFLVSIDFRLLAMNRRGGQNDHDQEHICARICGRDGRWIINTGAFCRPLGACLVDLTPSRLAVRRIISREGAFHPGPVLA